MELKVIANGWNEDDGRISKKVFVGTVEECEKFMDVYYAWEYIDASYNLRYFTIEFA